MILYGKSMISFAIKIRSNQPSMAVEIAYAFRLVQEEDCSTDESVQMEEFRAHCRKAKFCGSLNTTLLGISEIFGYFDFVVM